MANRHENILERTHYKGNTNENHSGTPFHTQNGNSVWKYQMSTRMCSNRGTHKFVAGLENWINVLGKNWIYLIK